MLENLGPVPFLEDMIDLKYFNTKNSIEMYLSLANSLKKKCQIMNS